MWSSAVILVLGSTKAGVKAPCSRVACAIVCSDSNRASRRANRFGIRIITAVWCIPCSSTLCEADVKVAAVPAIVRYCVCQSTTFRAFTSLRACRLEKLLHMWSSAVILVLGSTKAGVKAPCSRVACAIVCSDSNRASRRANRFGIRIITAVWCIPCSSTLCEADVKVAAVLAIVRYCACQSTTIRAHILTIDAIAKKYKAEEEKKNFRSGWRIYLRRGWRC